MVISCIYLMGYLHRDVSQNPKRNNSNDKIPATIPNSFAFCSSSVSVVNTATAPKKQEAAKANMTIRSIIFSIFSPLVFPFNKKTSAIDLSARIFLRKWVCNAQKPCCFTCSPFFLNKSQREHIIQWEGK